MELWQAALLGIIEGLTEFLPVSSTGHLTIAERLMGLDPAAPEVTAFTAVVQFGAILAVLLYFRRDLWALVTAGLAGLVRRDARDTPEWRLACAVLVGSLPIGVIGFVLRDLVRSSALRNLVTVGVALIAWSAVMVVAERRATQTRGEADVTTRDTLVIGLVQSLALVPGVSRSGATISAGLLRGIDRVTATRLSFFLAIPAVTAAALLELPRALQGGAGAAPTALGTALSFVVAYAAVAFLLKFVARHSIVAFVPYRVALGTVVLVVLAVRAA